MKSPRQATLLTLLAVTILMAYTNCGKSGFHVLNQQVGNSMGVATSTPLPILGNEPNVLEVKVGCGYINEPCVSVTICTPGTNTCQTIPNILLDTGSYGLRLFSTLVTVSLTTSTIAGGTLAQCVSYADGTSDWGPVKTADVILGQERAAKVPIQIIDSTFAQVPSDCTRPDVSPSMAGYNGILGVGLFTEDCGVGCAQIANNRIYFSCTGTLCVPSAVPVNQQVANPVAFLPINNNGTILQFPSVPEAGAEDITGYLVLGIGTRENNTPSKTQFFQADNKARILTEFNGKTYSSFIDSGSNALFFPGPPSLVACDANSGVSGFYCPATATPLNAVQTGARGGARVSVDFQIISAQVAMSTNNSKVIFNNIGGGFPGAFDWGLPFFFGRTIYNGIDGKNSSLGTGPYWAY